MFGRAKILKLLSDGEEHSFLSIVESAGIKRNTAIIYLFKLKKEGLIEGNVPAATIAEHLLKEYAVKLVGPRSEADGDGFVEKKVLKVNSETKVVPKGEVALHLMSFYQQMDELETEWLRSGLMPDIAGWDYTPIAISEQPGST